MSDCVVTNLFHFFAQICYQSLDTIVSVRNISDFEISYKTTY